MYLEILKNLRIFPLFMSIFGCMLYYDKAHSRYTTNVNTIVQYTYAIILVYTVIRRRGVRNRGNDNGARAWNDVNGGERVSNGVNGGMRGLNSADGTY